ncbi:Fungalysin metallopeptidase-domain-containing protein [Catenaria anguillulae PL171]|uniref:Extracellular metalloproteinase n=1 Tax=Catenaria anguillulae PL171 TaxID=765915 RepID=A0A1Y2HD35_9FUNG|nr:Fungalysin metallopeptidase-domain-containing protein [Catenaria anguillulae PL171]
MYTGPALAGGLPHAAAPTAHLIKRQAGADAVARAFLAEKLRLQPNEFKQQDAFTDEHNGVTHVHFMQVVRGTEVTNGIASVSVDKQGNVIAFSETFAGKTAVASLAERKSKLDPAVAVAKVADHLRGELKMAIPNSAATNLSTNPDDKDAEVVWVKGASFAEDRIWTKPRLLVANPDEGNESLQWVVDVRVKTAENWFNAQVSNAPETAKVIGLVDWTSAALYRVFPSVGFASDPGEGQAALVQDPEDTQRASPRGWVAQQSTSGNNIIAQESGRTRENPLAQGSIDPQLNKLAFNFRADPNSGNPKAALDASLTNAFYASNLMHDILFLYGFNEQSGNFQNDNFGRGGQAGDAVVVNVQDDSSLNNANMRTPPDGQPGVMNAFLFDASGKLTDGAMSNDIIFHEYTHGMVSRLTGGGSNPNCLSGREAGGMNEGWADIVAVMLKQRAGATRDTNAAIAVFNMGKASGIRRFPYSTSTSTNPLTYRELPQQRIVHQLGEIWASMLFEAYWNMVDKHGFSADWRLTPATAERGAKLGGNVLFMQLLVDGMKLQGCNPTFRQARDAILLADRQNNQGQNQCELWRGFAKRGLGLNAGTEGQADFSVPPECSANRRMVKF